LESLRDNAIECLGFNNLLVGGCGLGIDASMVLGLVLRSLSKELGKSELGASSSPEALDSILSFLGSSQTIHFKPPK